MPLPYDFPETERRAIRDERERRAERGEVPRPRNLVSAPVRLKDGVWYRLVDKEWVEIEPKAEARS